MIMCKDIKRMEHTVNVSHFWFIGGVLKLSGTMFVCSLSTDIFFDKLFVLVVEGWLLQCLYDVNGLVACGAGFLTY